MRARTLTRVYSQRICHSRYVTVIQLALQLLNGMEKVTDFTNKELVKIATQAISISAKSKGSINTGNR
jgi:hypothetical protein